MVPHATGDHHADEQAEACREVERRDRRIATDSPLTGEHDAAESIRNQIDRAAAAGPKYIDRRIAATGAWPMMYVQPSRMSDQ